MPRWSNIYILYLLSEIRKNPDKSDTELARNLGVSARTINRYRKLLSTLSTELP